MITGTYRATDALVIEIAPERPGYRPMQDSSHRPANHVS